MTTTTDLEHRLAAAQMPCPCTDADDSYGPTHSPNCRCHGTGLVYRWPELHQKCENVWCNIESQSRCSCAGLGFVPNVTLVSMLAALRAQYVDVSFSRAAGGWWVKVRQLRPPY